MSTKENRSIAYIYNEMDPSEKLEFERDLESDNDLLIEVESFKKVSQHLNKMRHINPPDHVVQAVYESAKRSSTQPGNNHWKTFFFSAAALLLIAMTAGIFMGGDQQSEAGNDQPESASVSSAPVFPQRVNTSTADNLSPWVDNNDILYFQGQIGTGNQADLDSIRNNNVNKLTPVTDQTVFSPYERLQLTGSHN